VLTGLSGAGKTQLARNYALSLWQDDPEPNEGLLIVPVQPGWHDYTSLLGYVNPLESDAYVRTGVLDFLLQASANPTKPYTLILDEMNLSHPEPAKRLFSTVRSTRLMVFLRAFRIQATW
jgi:5-methylcytosine-specific restriction endonuclease McrBC GTP-binding regulatory subunit McrB